MPPILIAASNFVANKQNILPIEIDSGAPPNSIPNPFNSDETLKAICIAPDSDVDTLLVIYPDPARPGAVTQTVVGVGAPFVGQINALNGGPSPQGRILFGTTRTFLGQAAFFAVPVGSPTPKLKAFGYFQNPPTLPITRAAYTSNAGGICDGTEKIFMRRAFYGRRVLYINMTAPVINAGNVTVRTYGWNLAPIPRKTLLNTAIVAPSAEAEVSIVNKFFDAIEMTIQGAAPDSVAVDFTFADAL